MNQKTISKILATILVITLTFANIILLGVYASKTYATSDNLERQGTATNNENVEFDAYFVNSQKASVHSIKQDINAQDTKMYVSVKVKKGYLKDAKIQIFGEQENKLANFKILNSNESLEMVQNIDTNNNIISLKQINKDTSTVLQIPITANKDNKFDLSNFSKNNGIKLIGSYISDEGKTVNIQKTIKARVEWNGVANVTIEQAVQRLIPFAVNNNKGIVLQTVVKTGIENNNLPIEQTNVNVTVPVINGIKPTKVNVTANNTLATNGKDGLKFGSENYKYNEETGMLNITVQNDVQDNIVSWEKNCKDEYVITYVYPELTIEGGIQTTQTVNAKIKVYNNTVAEVEGTITGKIETAERIGEIVTGKVTTLNENLSKGYLYTKSQRETEYKIETIVDIGYSELVDKLVVENGIDNFVNENGEMGPTSISNVNYAYYKTTTINKDNFDKILGTEGYVKILDQDGATLATFNKDAQTDENGNYTYSYVAETSKVTIETSKPITEGTLKIAHTKALKGNTDYSKEQIESFKVLKSDINTTATYADTVISKNQNSVNMNLIDPSTQVELLVNKTDLSTVVTNENVEFKTILKTNNITCDLYKNPVVEIVLPSYIEKVEIKDINLLFDNELQISKYETYKNQEGNVVIKVIITGEDTKYNADEVSKGANLVINTDITLKQLTPTKQDTVKVYVKNENATTHNTRTMSARAGSSNTQTAYAEVALNSVAPVGMVTTNTIEGYNSKNEKVTSISGQEQVGKLETKTNSKIAKVSMNVINNYTNPAQNVTILGKLPSEGDGLGSTVTASLNSTIQVNGNEANKATVYYSENANATKDLTLASNGWTTNATNTSKAYLIALNDELDVGDAVTTTYNLNIPENLSHNEAMYTNYEVNFDNQIDGQTVQESEKATKVGLTTGEGPELEVTITSDVENGANVQEGQIITYTATVKNVGKKEVQNVTLAGAIPEGSVYTYWEGIPDTELGIEQMYDETKKVYSEVIDSIEAGETEEIEYMVQVSPLTYNENNQLNEVNLTAYAQAKAEGNDTVFNSNKTSNKVVEGCINTNIEIGPIASTNKSEGEEFEYIISLTNVNSTDKNNVVITDVIPDGLTYISSSDDGKYDENSRTVTWNIDKLESNTTDKVVVKVKANNLENNQYEKTIKNKITIKADGKTIESNEISISVQKPALSIKQTCDVKGNKVYAGDAINYTVTVENVGKGVADSIVLADNIPEGLTYEGLTYTFKETTISNKIGDEEIETSLPVLAEGEKIEIVIKATVNSVSEDKEITNIARVSLDGEHEIESNQIKHTIIASETGTNNDPSTGGTSVEGTYKIFGTAWLDSNNDGKRDETESTLGGISVMLINSENGQIVKDSTTGQDKIQETDENGEYIFANLQSGKYIVVYLYDAGNYDITTYQKEGVLDTLNSDAIATKVNLYGEMTNVGVTNTIEITDSNMRNIDIGLIVSQKFDLKLDKVISKITVTDSKGTKVHTYKDLSLVKLDLNPKTINTANIVIEYKIRITNEGGVAGIAKKIVDYVPQEMKFSSELNKEWYSADNGNIYNSSLANTVIQPGETKELTLLLTKKMSDNNVGIINNTAEIYEASNDLGLADIDSTPANKVQNEDDMSSADAIIGLNTGEIYVYIAITIIAIGILGAGIYLINKKVLRKI